MNPFQKKVVVFTSAAHSLTHSFMLVFPSVQALIEGDFGVEPAAFYFIYGWSRLLFGSGAITAGPLADWLGSKKVLLFYLFGAAVSSILVGFAGGKTSLLVWLCFLGYFCSLYHTAGIKLVTKDAQGLGSALAYHGSAGNLGLALSPALSALIAYFFGWRGAYIFFGVLSFITAIALISAHIESVKHEDRTHQMIDGQHVQVEALALFLVPYMLLGFCYTGFITFMPGYLKAVMGLPIEKGTLAAGAVMTALYLIGSLGQFWGGSKANTGLLEKYWLMMLIIILPFFLLLWLGGSLIPIVIISGLGFPFIFFATQPISNSVLARYSSYRWRGRILSIGFFCSFGLGSFAAMIGKPFARQGSFGVIFAILAAANVAAIVMSAFLLRFVNRRGNASNA